MVIFVLVIWNISKVVEMENKQGVESLEELDLKEQTKIQKRSKLETQFAIIKFVTGVIITGFICGIGFFNIVSLIESTGSGSNWYGEKSAGALRKSYKRVINQGTEMNIQKFRKIFINGNLLLPLVVYWVLSVFDFLKKLQEICGTYDQSVPTKTHEVERVKGSKFLDVFCSNIAQINCLENKEIFNAHNKLTLRWLTRLRDSNPYVNQKFNYIEYKRGTDEDVRTPKGTVLDEWHLLLVRFVFEFIKSFDGFLKLIVQVMSVF
jgi:hypothetical protein